MEENLEIEKKAFTEEKKTYSWMLVSDICFWKPYLPRWSDPLYQLATWEDIDNSPKSQNSRVVRTKECVPSSTRAAAIRGAESSSRVNT